MRSTDAISEVEASEIDDFRAFVTVHHSGVYFRPRSQCLVRTRSPLFVSSKTSAEHAFVPMSLDFSRNLPRSNFHWDSETPRKEFCFQRGWMRVETFVFGVRQEARYLESLGARVQ
jgi:hypothetical protein